MGREPAGGVGEQNDFSLNHRTIPEGTSKPSLPSPSLHLQSQVREEELKPLGWGEPTLPQSLVFNK